MLKQIYRGISYNCCECGCEIKFPACPNADTDRWEALAHAIYTACVNDKKKCWRCESHAKLNSRRKNV